MTNSETPAAASDVLERFLRYVQIDSQSDPANDEVTPSTPTQHAMAELLAHELEELGCTDVTVDDHAYVVAHVAATPGAEDLPTLGLCAHIDSSFDSPASGIKPHVVHYEGGPLVAGVVDGKTVQTTPEQVPDLDKFIGHDIVVTDGSTLLSADDKAGVAEIMALLARLHNNPEMAHPRLAIAFVPDEEIGHGASLLDLEAFGAAWCYTVDGETLGEFNYETFSASEATVKIQGSVVHPGSAKGDMVNAITVAAEFQSMVPAGERPEYTEGREGFYHPVDISGASEGVTLTYILRDFDGDKLAERERMMQTIADFLNARYGADTVTVSIKSEYRNMAEKFDGLDFLVERALEANRMAGIEPSVVAVRGGTDGSQLTFRGLPCPNLATGGYNAHSVREFIPVSSLETTVDILQHLVAMFATKA